VSALPNITLADQVASYPFWYHRIELPDGVVTPGWAPLNQEMYRIPQDMTGMRVLDVGAWDGYWSFEALKRGASQVVAIDDFSDFLGRPENVDRRAWETFDLCRDAFGYGKDRCERVEMSIYEVNESRLGRFDAVFFFGVLYHLRHPLLALDFLSSVCDKEIYIESAVLDDYSPYRGGLGQGYSGAQVLTEFYPNGELGGNVTNWWSPTLACLGLMVMSAGWEDVEVWKLTDNPTEVPHCRGFAKGVKGTSNA
jgi:tRNA (mo5U34)-methyltransferase